MPFDNGSITLTFFDLRAELPEDTVELFAAHKAGTLDSVPTDPEAEPQIGWVTGRHLLDTQIDEGSAYCGSMLNLALRRAERKLPTALLNAICKREEFAYMQTNQSDYVPSKVKKSIKEDVIAKHLSKMPPALSAVPLVIDPKENVLYLGTASTSQIDLFIENFFQTTKVEPLQMTPASLLEKHFQTTESSFPTIAFADSSENEPVIGRDFLTWLWYFSENGGKVTVPPFGDFEVLVEAPFTFALAAEANGAEETVIKKGNCPQRSAEAKAALAVGKKLKKAKFAITCGNNVWSGNFDADKFAFGSLKLPETESSQPTERFLQRMEFLLTFKQGFEAFFKQFAESCMSMDFPETEKAMRQWAKDRDAI